MIQLNIDFNPLGISQYVGNISDKLNKNLDKALKASALAVRNYAVVNIQRGTRTGRTYKRRTITHVASAAGEFPKTDGGDLVKSIRTDFGPLTAYVGSDLDYSLWLEKGTGKMAARPWLQPSLDANAPLIKALINEAIRRSAQ